VWQCELYVGWCVLCGSWSVRWHLCLGMQLRDYGCWIRFFSYALTLSSMSARSVLCVYQCWDLCHWLDQCVTLADQCTSIASSLILQVWMYVVLASTVRDHSVWEGQERYWRTLCQTIFNLPSLTATLSFQYDCESKHSAFWAWLTNSAL